VEDYKRTMKKFIKNNRYFWIGLLDQRNRCVKQEKVLEISSLVLSIFNILQRKGIEPNKREREQRKAVYDIIIKGKM